MAAARTFYPRCLVQLTVTMETLSRLTVEGSATVAGQRYVERTTAADRTITIVAIPAQASWTDEAPGVASTARVSIEWDALPLDPRAVQDCIVTIWCADVEDPRVDLYVGNTEARRFVGFVDRPSATFAEGQDVELSARDYSGRLLDWPYNGAVVDITRPFSQVIQAVIGQHPAYTNLLSQGLIEVEDDIRPQEVIGRPRWTPPKNAKLWDVVTALARDIGMVVQFDLDTLRVRAPAGPDPARKQRFVYGDNVDRVEISRDLSTINDRAILLRARNPATRVVTEARWPPVNRSGETIQAFPLSGAWTKERLQLRARGIYEAFRRQQLEGNLETITMQDVDGDDVVDLRAGDTIEIRVRNLNADTVLGMSRGRLARYLVDHGLDDDVADELASRWVEAEDFTPLFFVRRAAHEWSRGDGYALSVDFENLVIPPPE